jgi:hypothetical protein
MVSALSRRTIHQRRRANDGDVHLRRQVLGNESQLRPESAEPGLLWDYHKPVRYAL